MKILLSAALCFLLQEVQEGTTSTRPLLVPEAGTAESIKLLLEPYQAPQAEFSWKLRKRIQKEHSIEYTLTFPSPISGTTKENDTVWAHYWTPNPLKEKQPAVVALHWLGGSYEVLEVLCRRMAEEGICTLMVYMPHYGPRRAKDRSVRKKMISEDLECTTRSVRQAVLDVRRATDWLSARPEVDGARVGIMGISLGAIISSLTAGIDPRYFRCVFLLGGGDLPAIVLHPSSEMEDLRARLVEQGTTEEQLRETWKSIEPLTYASRIRAKDVLMINAAEDDIVPKACTLKLQEAIGVPSIEWVPGKHVDLIFQLGKVIPRLMEHFGRP